VFYLNNISNKNLETEISPKLKAITTETGFGFIF